MCAYRERNDQTELEANVPRQELPEEPDLQPFYETRDPVGSKLAGWGSFSLAAPRESGKDSYKSVSSL